MIFWVLLRDNTVLFVAIQIKNGFNLKTNGVSQYTILETSNLPVCVL